VLIRTYRSSSLLVDEDINTSSPGSVIFIESLYLGLNRVNFSTSSYATLIRRYIEANK